MAITNPSFETTDVDGGIDRPGLAEGWELYSGGYAWEWAVFDSLGFLAEDFEILWSGNEDRRTVFGSSDLDSATFDNTTPESYEDFEEEWSNNELRKTEFLQSQLDDPTFDSGTPEAFEDFEEEWSSNEDRRTVFGGGELDDATFDVAVAEAFEDFEEEWSDNEDRRIVFGGGELDDPTFVQDAGTTDVERFGDDVAKIVVPATVSVGTPVDLEPTQPNRIVFGGTLTGALEVQVRRQGFLNWDTYDTATSVPATVELPAGYSEVRLERTILGGTTTADIHWPELTAL
jgi:hypothetical protein